ncbi:SdpI family protein [uncultured Micrococcus sp.]|uniref:SdpI family protein n=1 Tax=uncultured Micrococcus sp. TaxID=114051 RepID=UPI002596942E|nr:SdpI family protein [uncultured Micrococcus sp.]
MDNVVFVVAAVIGALAALVTLVVSRPSAMARRGPNPAIGIRTSETMRDAGTWNAAHEAAWPWLRAACLSAFVLEFAMVGWLLFGGPSDSAVTVGHLVAIGLFGLGAVVAARRGHVAAREQHRRRSGGFD